LSWSGSEQAVAQVRPAERQARRQPTLLGGPLAFLEVALLDRTLFPKSVKDAPAVPGKSSRLFVLKSAAGNKKLGNGRTTFTKGRFIGMPLYSLTLEERATCPTSCSLWKNCYSNSMPFATRYNVNAELYRALSADVERLSAWYPRGFVVRLHVVGDFSSVEYVEFWRGLFERYPQLHVFGYTHREHGTPIGDAVAALVQSFPTRMSVLRSDGAGAGDPLPPALVIPKDTSTPAVGTRVVCPEQTGAADNCLECGLCTLGRIGVSFIDHGRVAKAA